ncbi:MAG: endonuclease III [Rickettsiales bacterium]|jgi:endonuclease III|nr:endonuclease III [Rickettsiales bacterium]
MLNKQQIIDIFTLFRDENPEPKTELEYSSDFTLLVSIVLSAQATDVSVNKATKPLFAKYNTAELILDLGIDGLKQYIKTIGLYNSKAKNIITLCNQLINQYNGVIPKDLDELQNLAGVGRKTANVFLNCAYGFLTMGVDTHVFRVANRIGLTKAKNPVESEKQLLKKIPKEFKLHAHHWLILHGRYVCKARKPICNECKISDYCNFKP